MKITKKQIKKLEPCADGWAWYLEHQEKGLLKLLRSLNSDHPDWARWLFTNLMTNKQCVQIAIFSAELVIGACEFAHPDNKRPRDAINAAKDWLKNPTDAAAYATHAADAAADAAYAAAHAAYAAAHAADAAAYAAAHTAADAAGRKKIQVKIIKEAVRILEETE